MNTYWENVWFQFKKHRLGLIGLIVCIIFFLVGVYAPILASSKPLWVYYDGEWYFPLFRYLFYSGFYTKLLDIFFNIMMFTLPLFLLTYKYPKVRWGIVFVQFAVFFYLAFSMPKDPAADKVLAHEKQTALLANPDLALDWPFELQHMTPYAKLNQLLRYQQRKTQSERLEKYNQAFQDASRKKFLATAIREKKRELQREGINATDEEVESMILADIPESALTQTTSVPTLWQQEQNNEAQEIARQKAILEKEKPDSEVYKKAQLKLTYIQDRRKWLDEQSKQLKYEMMPLVRSFHWEDDAGGEQSLNQYIPWYELTRINRKDLVAALIFGVRISLVVGVMAVGLALMIGIPFGAYAGYYGGTFDIVVSRLREVWEAMPTFFMLLMVVAITQSKSIFLVIAVIGIFGWPTFSQYIRGEFFKQRNLPYVEACRAQGFRDPYIMFSHILPNAIPPVLTLLPFAMMGAITSEAGLSFLGLGEEGSASWGVLMDEGRSAFPGESYLLWPPAILLTLLLVAIALVGDALRDAIDPKMYK